MNFFKSIIIAVILISLHSPTAIFATVADGVFIFDIDSVETREDKTEYLLNTAQKLREINSSLSYDAIFQACNASEGISNLRLKIDCKHLKGIILSERGEIDTGLPLLKEVLKYYEEMDEKRTAALILTDIGRAYFVNSQFAKASLYYNSALSEFDKLSDTINIVASSTYIGQSDALLGNNDKAINTFTDIIDISEKQGYNYFKALNYLELSRLQLSLNTTDTVLYQLNTALNIAGQYHYSNLIGEAYLLLSRYYTLVDNNIEASNQLNKFINYTDSINEIEYDKQLSFITNLLNVKLSTSDEPKTKVWYWLLIAAIIIVIIFVLYRIITKKYTFKNEIDIIKAELDAYEESSDDLAETIDIKSKERLLEIEDEISNNNDLILVIKESLNNLNHINHLKDIFLSKISHEIRTPLSGILGFSEILETELALMEDHTLFEYANNISQSGQGLVLLLNNILDISRLDSNNMKIDFKPLVTSELIQGVVDRHFSEANLKGLKLLYAVNNIPDIYTDSQIFSKIISLILDNAIKFTEKGFIKISHFHDADNNNIVVLIKDTGIGIDKVYIDQVFMPFRQESLGYSTSYQGAGLGLPLAKKMSLKLNGDIKIESEKGSGTTITLYFPAYKADMKIDKPEKQEQVVDRAIAKPVSKLPWAELSVLVVEDDNMNQILYRKLLKGSRFLEVAKDGKTALSMIERQIENNNYQLVLMDINLPAPWDGISLMKEIRQKWPDYKNIPFIAQTAYAISGNRESMLYEGFDEYITKPIIKSALIETINKVLSLD